MSGSYKMRHLNHVRRLATGLAVLVFCTVGALPGQAQGREPVEAAVPGEHDDVLFTFGVFGDNSTAFLAFPEFLGVLKTTRPSFVVGMGDFFLWKWEWFLLNQSIGKAYGDERGFYDRFYPVAGDNECSALSGRQDIPGGERPLFEAVGILQPGTNTPARSTVIEVDPGGSLSYYAQLRIGGLRLHLLMLYDQDSVTMPDSARAFAERIADRILRDHAGDPWIVAAHDALWWEKADFPDGHPIYACDLLLSASWHAYLPRVPLRQGSALAYVTPSVGRDCRSWLGVMVLRDRLVVLNLSDQALAVKGNDPCYVKPFGKPSVKGAAGPWFDKLAHYGKTLEGDWGPAPE
jgi:hypothetical protein